MGNRAKKTRVISLMLVGLFLTLAACGGGGGESGTENCIRTGLFISIEEPSGSCTTYITKAPSVELSGLAFVSPGDVDCVNVLPSQLNLKWHNTSTGQTGTGGIFSFCRPFFGGLKASTIWVILVTNLQFGSNVINLTATDQLGKSGTTTITIERVNDIVAPSITSHSPASDEIDVRNNRTLTVRFSEDMLLGSLTDERFTVVDELGVPVSGLRNYDQANFTWSFNPSSDLLFSTTYTVTIGGGVEDRYGGNVLGADVSWSFTTGPNPDVTGPQVIQVSPEPGTQCAATGTTILARFDEPLDSTTVDATTFLLIDSDGIPVSGSVTYDGATAQLVPDVALASISTYEATVTAAIRDLADNPLGTDFSWTFTTDSAPVGGWVPMSTANAPSERSKHTAVWTGTEMIVWGGLTTTPSGDFVTTNTGGRYDPVSDAWIATSTLNAPHRRVKHTVVWTGTEMIIWGGGSGGARYDPGTDSWQTLSTTNDPFDRAEHIAVWTGTEMIIWGGFSGGRSLNSGGRYDPNSDSWQAMSTVGAPSPRVNIGAVWTGTELIVWGGNDGGPFLNDGARYNPQSDTWIALPDLNAPSVNFSNDNSTIWTGTEMLAWDGGRQTFIDSSGFPRRQEPSLRIYNPATDTWRVTGSICEPFMTNYHAQWTGNQMIVWSGSPGLGGGRGGYFYDPVVDDWESIATMSGPRPRREDTSIWAVDRFILWGGIEPHTGGGFTVTGFIFRE